jgi:hypothetical protein
MILSSAPWTSVNHDRSTVHFEIILIIFYLIFILDFEILVTLIIFNIVELFNKLSLSIVLKILLLLLKYLEVELTQFFSFFISKYSTTFLFPLLVIVILQYVYISLVPKKLKKVLRSEYSYQMGI